VPSNWVQSVIELHGAALERMLENIAQTLAGSRHERCNRGRPDREILLLHGLHPDPIEARVLRALAKVRPYLHFPRRRCRVVECEGIVRIKLIGSCESCPSSALTLKSAGGRRAYEARPTSWSSIAEKSQAELNSHKLVVLK